MVERIRQVSQARADYIRYNAAKGNLTPRVVAEFASLLLTDDQHLPIFPAVHHSLWLKLVCDERIRKLLIVAPPESAKTTWLATGYMACRIGFYPASNNIIASMNSDTALARSLAIRNIVESPAWRDLFPGIEPATGLKWEQGSWSVAQKGVPDIGELHPTLESFGTGQGIVGTRADLLLGDDLIDDNLSRTPGEREHIKAWFHNSFLSRLKAGGRVILIGTMFNTADLYSEIRRDPQDWVVCHMPSYQPGEDGAPFYADIHYPEGWPYEMLGEPARSVEVEHANDVL